MKTLFFLLVLVLSTPTEAQWVKSYVNTGSVYNARYIGGTFSAGFNIAEKSFLSMGYTHWRNRDTIRNSYHLTVAQELVGDEVIGGAIVFGLGTETYFDAGIAIYLKQKIPVYMKLSSTGLSIGVWKSF